MWQVNNKTIKLLAKLIFEKKSLDQQQADWIRFYNQELLEKSQPGPSEWKIDVFGQFLASKVLPSNPDISVIFQHIFEFIEYLFLIIIVCLIFQTAKQGFTVSRS